MKQKVLKSQLDEEINMRKIYVEGCCHTDSKLLKLMYS